MKRKINQRMQVVWLKRDVRTQDHRPLLDDLSGTRRLSLPFEINIAVLSIQSLHTQ